MGEGLDLPTTDRKNLWFGLGGAAAAAGLFALACPPFGLAPLAWLVPGLLLLAVRRLPLRHAFEAGLLFGVLSAALVHRWLPEYLMAGLRGIGWEVSPLVGSLVTFAGIAVSAGIPCGAMAALYGVAARRVSRTDLAVAGAFLWVTGEWLRSQVVGWQLIGHTQYRELWLIQVADLGGVLAVSFVMAFASIAAFETAAGVGSHAIRVSAGVRNMIMPAAALLVAFGHGLAAKVTYDDVTADAIALPDGSMAHENASFRQVATTSTSPEYTRPALRIRQVALEEQTGLRVGPLLCEDLFDGGIVHAVIAAGADVLINNCRVDWFADSPSVPEQHLAQAVFRAVESRRFLVRATANGGAELITALGEVYDDTPVGRTLAISTDTTRYLAVGDRWVFIGLGVSLVVIGRGRRATDRRESPH